MLTTATFAVLALLGTPPNFGMSDEEILGSGRDGWVEFYCDKVGSNSTMALCDAQTAYGKAFKRVNDRKLTHATKAKRDAVKTLRDATSAYALATYQSGYIAGGGGTMWQPMIAGVLADSEDVVASYLNPQLMSLEHETASDAEKAMTHFEMVIKHLKSDMDSEKPDGSAYRDAMRNVAEMKKQKAFLVSFASKQNRAHSDYILNFVLDTANQVASLISME